MPGSQKVLIKYTGVVAAVAVPQLLGSVWGSGMVLNDPRAWQGRGGSEWVSLWSAMSGRGRAGL